MKQILFIILFGILITGLLTGCSTDEDSSSNIMGNTSVLAPIVLPEGASLESATMYIYVNQSNNQPITVHRITAPWEEMTITWNNFGASYDPMMSAVFIADTLGWKSTDITGIVSSWLDGTYPDYGILIDQAVEIYPRAEFNSREALDNHPYLEICYSLDGEMYCEQANDVGDAYIWELEPDWNKGDENYLATGWIDSTFLEKQSVIKFEFRDVEQPDSSFACLRTIGYWKNHAGFGPQANEVSQYLPIWLGTDGGANSPQVTDSAIAVDVLQMKTYGHSKNGITKLYAQLLAAKLNIAAGSASDVIDTQLADADSFLADHSWTEWFDLTDEEKIQVLNWKSTFDDYNKGRIGPGHCEDDVDEEAPEE